MDKVILKIRLSQESKQWDIMMEKIEEYLKIKQQDFIKDKTE